MLPSAFILIECALNGSEHGGDAPQMWDVGGLGVNGIVT